MTRLAYILFNALFTTLLTENAHGFRMLIMWQISKYVFVVFEIFLHCIHFVSNNLTLDISANALQVDIIHINIVLPHLLVRID